MFSRTSQRLFYLLAVTVCGVICATSVNAQTDSPLPPHLAHQWRKIAAIPPGTPILVHEQYARGPASCVLVWIDNHVLACDTLVPSGATRRLVYPAASLDSVIPDTPLDEPESHHGGVLFGMAIGGVLGGLAGSHAGVGPGFIGAALGGSLGGGMVATAWQAPNGPRPQWSLRVPLRSHPFAPLRR